MDLNMVAVSWLEIMDVYAYFTARGLRGSSMHLESVYDVRNWIKIMPQKLFAKKAINFEPKLLIVILI